jgi:hypothetical protein
MQPNWRIVPTPGQQIAVERIAKREDRSLSNVLRILVREALLARGELPRHVSSDDQTSYSPES